MNIVRATLTSFPRYRAAGASVFIRCDEEQVDIETGQAVRCEARSAERPGDLVRGASLLIQVHSGCLQLYC